VNAGFSRGQGVIFPRVASKRSGANSSPSSRTRFRYRIPANRERVSDIVGRVKREVLSYIERTDSIDLRSWPTERSHRGTSLSDRQLWTVPRWEVSFTQMPPEAGSSRARFARRDQSAGRRELYKNCRPSAPYAATDTGKMLDDELGLGYEDEC